MGTIALRFKLINVEGQSLSFSRQQFSRSREICQLQCSKNVIPLARVARVTESRSRRDSIGIIRNHSRLLMLLTLRWKDPPTRPRSRKLSRPRFRAARTLQYFGCRWQRWQVTYTRSVDTKRRCDLQDTPPWWYSTAGNTHGTLIPEAFLPRSFFPPCALRRTRARHVPVYIYIYIYIYIYETAKYLSLSDLQRALDLPQHNEHTPDFLSADRVKEGRGHIGGKGRKEEKTLFTMRGYIRDISSPLSVPRCRSNSSGSAHVCVYPLEEKGRSQPSLAPPPPPLTLSLSLSLSLIPSLYHDPRWSWPLSTLLPTLSPWAREIERPFEICRWPKHASRTALRLASNPRFLSFNWKLAERCYRTTCYRSTLSSSQLPRRLRDVYASGDLRAAFATKFSRRSNFPLCPSVRPSVYLCLCLSLSRAFIRSCKMYAWYVQCANTPPEIHNLLDIGIPFPFFPFSFLSFLSLFPFLLEGEPTFLRVPLWKGEKEFRYITRFAEKLLMIPPAQRPAIINHRRSED